MIVYVESNFVFEVAFQRGDHQAAVQLLEIAEQQKIELVIPAYSIGEPYERSEEHTSELQSPC